ncbi:MSF1-domain-containing protein [Ascobolus immersus RN42]|uniref:MSF1-domain-containing protein n=1 Tax=Ascobolus immersus RN42 TaxID=1160509 RepID=A0A3N4IMI5_ASCIM|nr:MSF1-domain-containing protein [Ascobolus immersus RN42]
MVKFFDNVFSYEYPFSAVTLAYYLRYPNPYSTHVLSADTLSRDFDPVNQTLTTTRLLLKRGKLPSSVTRFLPKIKESYILEKSVVDLKKMEMRTETRNLEWEGVLSVVESQTYTPLPAPIAHGTANDDPLRNGTGLADDHTSVRTVVRFESRLGGVQKAEGIASRVASWGTGGVQRGIEAAAYQRMKENVQRSKEGLKIVLHGLREKGVIATMVERRERKVKEMRERATGWGGIWGRNKVEAE